MASLLNDANFSEKTKAGNSVVDFYADWCGPCQLMKPIFDKVSKDFEGVNFYKVDVDESQENAANFGVRSIPTVIFLKNGKEVDRFLGVVPETELRSRVKRAFGI